MNKAQISLEYLVVYGIMITTVLIGIGVLTGAFNFSVIKQPDRCQYDRGIYCKEFAGDEQGIIIVLVNEFQEDIIVKGFDSGCSIACTESNEFCGLKTTTWKAASKRIIDIPCESEKGRYELDQVITYTKADSNFELHHAGRVSLKAE